MKRYFWKVLNKILTIPPLMKNILVKSQNEYKKNEKLYFLFLLKIWWAIQVFLCCKKNPAALLDSYFIVIFFLYSFCDSTSIFFIKGGIVSILFKTFQKYLFIKGGMVSILF
jgi:hypothetical protein